jgi:hypothetical protein
MTSAQTAYLVKCKIFWHFPSEVLVIVFGKFVNNDNSIHPGLAELEGNLIENRNIFLLTTCDNNNIVIIKMLVTMVDEINENIHYEIHFNQCMIRKIIGGLQIWQIFHRNHFVLIFK